MSADQGTGAPQYTPVCRRVVRAMKNVALALLRALWIGSVDVLLSVLLSLARPARVVLKLGIIGLLLILVMEGMNHWRGCAHVNHCRRRRPRVDPDT